MSIITKYLDYHIFSTNFFIERIQAEINGRDIAGITSSRTAAISVSGEHPLVRLTGSLLENGQANFAGLMPGISVIEGDSGEEATTLGQGKKTASIITSQFVTDLRQNFPTANGREHEGLISNNQISAIETALEQNNGKLLVLTAAYWERESVFVSLWAEHSQERNVLLRLLKSILYDLRTELSARDVRDVHITTSSGLINLDFGRILHGAEVEMSFLNKFTTYTVMTDVPLADQTTFTLDINGKYQTYGQRVQDQVTIWEAEEEA